MAHLHIRLYVYTRANTINREISLTLPKIRIETSKVKAEVTEGRATGGESGRGKREKER